MGNFGLNKYASGEATCEPRAISMPTMKDRLAAAVERAKERLASAEEAKAIFDKNPDLERLLDLMQKGLF